MIDTVILLNNIDLRVLIEGDTESADQKRVYCPFCQAGPHTAPAMQIYDRRFYCFGCGAGGDAIDYIMLRDRVDFLEACRRLGWSGDQPSQAEMDRARIEYMERKNEDDRKRAERLDQLLTEFTTGEIWAAYHRKMSDEHVRWWESQGIPKEWQDYLRLGFTPGRAYYTKNKELKYSPAYTIPYFHYDFIFWNIQYRLQDPDNPKDRYRFEAGLKTTYYMTTPSEAIRDQVVICEGAKKAMVCRIRGELGDWISVLAIPSKVDFGSIHEAVKDCGLVWIIGDPDAWDKPLNAPASWLPPPIKLGRLIGRAARLVRLPIKVDDGILSYGLVLSSYMKMAVKP